MPRNTRAAERILSHFVNMIIVFRLFVAVVKHGKGDFVGHIGIPLRLHSHFGCTGRHSRNDAFGRNSEYPLIAAFKNERTRFTALRQLGYGKLTYSPDGQIAAVR